MDAWKIFTLVTLAVVAIRTWSAARGNFGAWPFGLIAIMVVLHNPLTFWLLAGFIYLITTSWTASHVATPEPVEPRKPVEPATPMSEAERRRRRKTTLWHKYGHTNGNL